MYIISHTISQVYAERRRGEENVNTHAYDLIHEHALVHDWCQACLCILGMYLTLWISMVICVCLHDTSMSVEKQ